jgi:hypothetical protein
VRLSTLFVGDALHRISHGGSSRHDETVLHKVINKARKSDHRTEQRYCRCEQ